MLGQEAIIRILRQFIITGRGRSQSYLFAGQWGGGKTTLARILARALLCDHPTATGDPCDQCSSCKSILELGSSLDFTEVDAATSSGKDKIEKIKESLQYDSFTGRRRLYLMDEAHQLTKGALEGLLKPLEDTIPGTQEKRLICIFCTTEPEKMVPTIFSRCAPTFMVQPVAPEIIGKRLCHVCDQEGIAYDPEMLTILAEMTGCHIRDALKAIEGISMLGAINRENVGSYMQLDLNSSCLSILEVLGQDIAAVLTAAKQVLAKASAATCYEKLAELAMVVYQTHIGVGRPPVYLDEARVRELGARQGSNMLAFATRFASRPGRPNASMLFCDLGLLHHAQGQMLDRAAVVLPSPNPTVVASSAPAPAPVLRIVPTETVANVMPLVGKIHKMVAADGSPTGQGAAVRDISGGQSNGRESAGEISPKEFARFLGLFIQDRLRSTGGST